MAKFAKVNNERSEAIELIKFMDSLVKKNTWHIKYIGGESTLNTGKQRMFPDIFVYGDTSRTQILQGWEVKMPDVAITNSEFINDAQRKADVLGVNSCFIWNFKHGVLYVKDNSGAWAKTKEWAQTSHIKTRPDVVTYKSDWEKLIEQILFELNGFFVSGELRSSRLDYIISDSIFTEIIARNKNISAEHLKSESIKNTVIKSYVSQWWKGIKDEYKFDETDLFTAYAKFILLNWINKFTFAHMIKRNHNPAALVEQITKDLTPTEAVNIFDEITNKCDFFNIFEALEYGVILPRSTWLDLTDYNAFLSSNGISQIPQEAFQAVLENSINQFKRNISGLFTTPPKLAEILAKAAINDLSAPCIDPCCGTGTIAREIIMLKEKAIGIEKAYATTYASDKNSFPLQVSNISMTMANAINLPSLLFKSNAFDLFSGKEIYITNPQNGEKEQYLLLKFKSVISNLPFVAFDQEGREEADYIKPILKNINAESKLNLSARADLYQAVLLNLRNILDDNASIGVITSNSWLGTLAGQEFFNALNYYYVVEGIVASGKGKWFDNADVITLMLFLQKKNEPQKPETNHKIYFGLIQKQLHELLEDDVNQIVDSIKLKQALAPEILSFKIYNISKIQELLNMNITLNSLFYNVDWLLKIDNLLCDITDLFEVFRGIKTGQDDIYYLRKADDVDSEYVGEILKSAKSCEYLNAKSDAFTFVCDKTLEPV